MTIRTLPPARDLTECNRGILMITPEVLGTLLGIEPRNVVVGCEYSENDRAIRLLIQGEDMPPSAENGKPPNVSLVCHISQLADEKIVDASWAHRPEERWRVK